MKDADLFVRWRDAVSWGRWPRVLVAAALGQVVGVAAEGRLDFLAWGVGAATVVLQLASVGCLRGVFAFHDRQPAAEQVDADASLRAGVGLGCLAVALSLTAEFALGRGGLSLGALVILVALAIPGYVRRVTTTPGPSELLDLATVGLLVPWWHAYCQSGEPLSPGLVVLPGFALLVLADHLAATLTDETSRHHERSPLGAARYDSATVRSVAEGLILGAILGWGVLPRLVPEACAPWSMLPAILVLIVEYRAVRDAGDAEDVETYLGASRYRRAVQRALVRAALTLAAGLAVGVPLRMLGSAVLG